MKGIESQKLKKRKKGGEGENECNKKRERKRTKINNHEQLHKINKII